MTKDFRHVGRIASPQDNAAEAAARQAEQLHPGQRIMLLGIQFAAIAFFAAGAWLLAGGASPLPEEITSYVGIALVLSALGDMVAVVVLRRAWSK